MRCYGWVRAVDGILAFPASAVRGVVFVGSQRVQTDGRGLSCVRVSSGGRAKLRRVFETWGVLRAVDSCRNLV